MSSAVDKQCETLNLSELLSEYKIVSSLYHRRPQGGSTMLISRNSSVAPVVSARTRKCSAYTIGEYNKQSNEMRTSGRAISNDYWFASSVPILCGLGKNRLPPQNIRSVVDAAFARKAEKCERPIDRPDHQTGPVGYCFLRHSSPEQKPEEREI